MKEYVRLLALQIMYVWRAQAKPVDTCGARLSHTHSISMMEDLSFYQVGLSASVVSVVLTAHDARVLGSSFVLKTHYSVCTSLNLTTREYIPVCLMDFQRNFMACRLLYRLLRFCFWFGLAFLLQQPRPSLTLSEGKYSYVFQV